MSKQPRKPSAQPDELEQDKDSAFYLEQDDDSAFYVMSIPGQRKGQEIGILADAKDADIVEMALTRSHGYDAIIQHLTALNVWELCFRRPDIVVSDAMIRSQDANLLTNALRENRAAEYLTLLLANAIVHALVSETLGSIAMGSIHKGMTVQRTLRKQEAIVQEKQRMIQEHEREIRNRVPKRQMRPDNRETLEQYRMLKQQFPKQALALQKLVSLPSELNKPYAKTYRDTKDYERLRQHIKRLDKTDRKAKASNQVRSVGADRSVPV